MAGFSDFIENLYELRKEIATFRKVVLHAHSPHSFDWKSSDLNSKDAIQGWTKEELVFIEKIEKCDLDMLAITDHMKCNFACRFSTKKIITKLIVLPGLELSIRPSPPWHKFRLHMLAIFPEKFSFEKASKIFPSDLPDEEDRTGKEEMNVKSIEEFVKNVHECGGLCIAAHIYTDRGVRRAFKQIGKDSITFYDPKDKLTKEEETQIAEDFKPWILSSGFDAIEVGKYEDKEHYRWIGDIYGKKISIPVLLTSDGHCVEDILNKDRFTYIKMTDVGYNDLEKALKFPDTRIRFLKDLPDTPSPRILGMQISSGNGNGFFKDLKIAFSDNLTCLIGPRGSGKSTIIEAIRYLFGYNLTLDQITDGKDLPKKVRELQEATLTSCIIRLAFIGKDGEPSILEATFDPKQDYVTRVYDKDGQDREISNVEASGRYPLRLFGWSEIETLGREAHRQRELLDRFVPDLQKKLEECREAKSSIIEKRAQIKSSILKMGDVIAHNRGEIKRYAEYKADFEKYNTQEVKDLFADYDDANEKLAILEKVRDNTRDRASIVVDMVEINILSEIGDVLEEKSSKVKKWWIEKKLSLNIDNLQENVRSHILKGQNILKSLLEKLEIEIQSAKKEVSETNNAIREEISEEDAKKVLADLRRTSKERLERVKQLRKKYNEEWNHFEGLLKDWRKACKRLVELKYEITGKRITQKKAIEAKLNQFKTKRMKITIEFRPGQDRSKFKEYLEEGDFFSRELHGNYKQKKWPERVSTLCNPVELALAILGNEKEKLIKSIDFNNSQSSTSIDEEMASSIVTTLNPFLEDDDAKISIVDSNRLSKIIKIAEIDWDDFERILLNDLPVDHLSPGQRSSAMLPLIALAETAPLVIDQPEDNLDNRMVGKMLVDILAELKEKRQIIVATHNPNIAVSGDAEQVIVLDALSSHEGSCKVSGSIDKEDIVEYVIDIMEGGREAFLNRKLRYRLD